jgi:drug/metabolite transporter (DMT)-like permease
MRSQGDRAALAAFLGGTVLAGGNAVCIRFSNRELDPLWGAGLRFTLAAAVLLAIAAALRLAVPRGRALAGAILYGGPIFGGAFALAYYSTVALSAWLDDEPLTTGLVLGGLLVLAGVYVGALRPHAEPDGEPATRPREA